jgi:hypothetical protein
MSKLYYDQIEDYHLGRLSAAESEAFQSALKDDPALAAALRERRLEWEASELLAEQILRAQVRQAFEEQPPSSSPDTKAPALKWVLPAFLLLLLLAGGIFYIWQSTNTPVTVPVTPQSTPTPVLTPPQDDQPQAPVTPSKPIAQAPKAPTARQLAIAAYRSPASLTQTRGNTTSDTLEMAYNAFSEKKYAKVLQLLTNLPEDERQEALSLRAHAHFATAQFVAASRDFDDLMAGGIYRREAQWFGLLADMSTPASDPTVWKTTLQSIKNDPAHPYQAAAEALWDKVGK